MRGLFGYMGKICRVDLTKRKTVEHALDKDLMKGYIGVEALI